MPNPHVALALGEQYGKVDMIKIPVTGNDACNIYVKWSTLAGAENALKV